MYEQVSSCVREAFRSVAVSLVLFHTYQERPQYRCPAALVPLPVWTFTVLPALILYEGKLRVTFPS